MSNLSLSLSLSLPLPLFPPLPLSPSDTDVIMKALSLINAVQVGQPHHKVLYTLSEVGDNTDEV